MRLETIHLGAPVKSRRACDTWICIAVVTVVILCTPIRAQEQTQADRPGREAATAAADLPVTNARPREQGVLTNILGTYGDLVLEGDAQFNLTGALVKGKPSRPSVIVETGTADANSGFYVFNAARNGPLLTVLGNGNVGVGGSVWTPTAKLDVRGGMTPMQVLGATSTGFGLQVYDSTAVGLGPGGVAVDITGNSRLNVGALQLGAAGSSTVNSLSNLPLYLNPWVDKDVIIGGGAQQSGLRVHGNGVTSIAGSVGIGTHTPNPAYKLQVIGKIHATGDIAADGTIFAKYQDVAEWVPAQGTIEAATVVIIAGDADNLVAPSTDAYDTRIAGVVSAHPGLVLGEGGDSKAMVATTGRVKVKVDATRLPIRRGDLLVSSASPGVAMRSEPIDVGGMKIHRPGTVIGKALEPLESGTGEILVLLSLQ